MNIMRVLHIILALFASVQCQVDDNGGDRPQSISDDNPVSIGDDNPSLSDILKNTTFPRNETFTETNSVNQAHYNALGVFIGIGLLI